MKKALTLSLLILLLIISGCWQRDIGRSYYESGKIRTEATVRNGLLDGPSVMFYESGAKMSEANYRSGVIDGRAVSYYESGVQKGEATYSEGILNGLSKNWDEDGRLLNSVVFINGRIRSE